MTEIHASSCFLHSPILDNGPEFQAKFDWHVEAQGMKHTYTKPRSSNINGEVERSHLTDELEFRQLLEYTDDVDRAEKLATWEEYHGLHRPRNAHKGRTRYESLRDKLLS